MKTALLIARLLLGVMFVVFGLNGFLHFLPQPPGPPVAQQFGAALFAAGFWPPIFALQLLGGLILLSGRYVPLGLVVLGPIIVNILLFHVLMEPAGIAPGLLALVLWLAVFYSVRSAFAGLFVPKVAEAV